METTTSTKEVMTAAIKYAPLIAAAKKAGYEVRLWQADDGSGVLDLEHPDHDPLDLGTLYYVQLNPGGRDVARHYDRATGIDEMVSLDKIYEAMKVTA